MARFVTFKRGGQPGRVGINPELVTDVRSSAGTFTDIFFGEHHVTVEGTFAQVLAQLADSGEPPAGPGGQTGQSYWLKGA